MTLHEHYKIGVISLDRMNVGDVCEYKCIASNVLLLSGIMCLKYGPGYLTNLLISTRLRNCSISFHLAVLESHMCMDSTTCRALTG